MKKSSKWLKVSALALIGAMTFSFAGCGGDKTTDGDEKLTYWVRLPGNIGTSVTNYSETPFAKKYAEETGITVEYIHPAQGQETESLNLMIASGELADIIESDWLGRNPESSIEKGTILRLNELIDKHAPNLKKFLKENPDIDRQVKTDSGSYYVFPFVRNGEKLLSTSGFMMRQDWLDELGLSTPETIDEWETVLTAFKDKKGAKSPFLANASNLPYFVGGFGVGYDFYVDNGQVKYGAVEDKFEGYLSTMNSWYKKGLIDKNFATANSDFITTNLLNGGGGAVFGAGGGGMGVWLNAAKNNGDTEFNLTAVKFPAEKKGEMAMFSNKQFPYSSINGAAISGKCKNPELAVKFLDYAYSEEGNMLNNFGIEGESYEMVDGQPEYTELITNNPDKLPMAQILTMYVRAASEGPFVQDPRYIEQYYQLEPQRKALDIWGANEGEKTSMPQITLTDEELTEFNRIMSDFKTFRDESVIEFIIGARPISEFKDFVAECKGKKIERAIAIQQAAYDRFIKR